MVEKLNNQRISDISATEFAGAVARNPVLLLPLGSQEDHGPYLPMGDFTLADRLAGEIAARATAAGTLTYAAPALPFGVTDYFFGAPGGMAISAAAFRAVLSDLLEGFRRHGLMRVVILNGHGGNAPVIHEVTLALRQAHGQVVPSFYLWKIARVLMARAAPDAAFGHGAEPLLSMTRALRPEYATFAAPPAASAGEFLRLPVSGFGTVDFEGLPVDVPAGFGEVPNDAIRAAAPDPALGGEIAAALVEAAVRFVGHFAAVS
jgi:creatinine amidohydrolase